MDFTYLTYDAVPKTLYHYTSLDALVSIVETKRLRASNIRFLNDESESLRLKEDVVAILRRLATTTADKQLVANVLHSIEKTPRQSHFVASLSERGDLLSQWRAYCPSGLGVSIGFSSSCLEQQWIADPRGEKPLFLSAPFQKVRYYETTHQSSLEKTVANLLNLARKEDPTKPSSLGTGVLAYALAPIFEGKNIADDELLDVVQRATDAISWAEGKSGQNLYLPGSEIAGWVTMLSPFIKHGAFSEECEWRKVVSKDSRLMPGQRFRSGKSTLIPFVEIMLDVVREGSAAVPSKKYFIDEVVVGPTFKPELTIEALRSLFESESHPEVVVRSSSIPFRSW
jgi:hypothetical protein